MREVLQVFGVGGELAQELPVAFDVAEEFLGDGLLFTGPGQAVLAEDAGHGLVTNRQGKLARQALGSEAGLATEFDALAFQASGSLMGARLGAAGEFLQGGGFAGQMAAEPLADSMAVPPNSRLAALRPCCRAQLTSFGCSPWRSVRLRDNSKQVLGTT
jgi:hypothetical protein